MSTRGGQIITQAGKYVLDRIQSGGPGDLNQPEEKIYELGNYESIATIRDIPEISYDVESFDMTTEFESILLNKVPSSVNDGDQFDFKNAVPIDIISPWKSRRGQYDITRGVVLPYLTLESASYKFGVGESSSQSFTLRGDSIFYTPGQPWYQEFTNTGTGPYTLTHAADIYSQGGNSIYVLSVCLVDSTSSAYKRLFYDATQATGYWNTTSTSVTLAEDQSATYDTIRVTYGTTAATADYTQTGNNPQGQVIHEDVTVKPAAIRGKDIDVVVFSTDATPVPTRMNAVQSAEATWSAALENDEELGNERYTSTEYDVPEVTGSIEVKPFDPADLFNKIAQITGVPNTEVIGPNITTPVPMEIRISHPDTGARLKTLYVPDARFSVPGFSGQANSVLTNTLSFTSDSGNLYVYKGAR